QFLKIILPRINYLFRAAILAILDYKLKTFNMLVYLRSKRSNLPAVPCLQQSINERLGRWLAGSKLNRIRITNSYGRIGSLIKFCFSPFPPLGFSLNLFKLLVSLLYFFLDTIKLIGDRSLLFAKVC